LMWSATVFVTWERESTCPTSEAQKFEDQKGGPAFAGPPFAVF